MPPLETFDLYQRATTWLATGLYDRYGQALIASSPTELAVRWITNRKVTLDPKKNTVTLDAQVITNQLVPIGSHMWLGTVDSWNSSPGTGFPPDDEIHEVVTYKQTSDIKNRNIRYEIGLKRLNQANQP